MASAVGLAAAGDVRAAGDTFIKIGTAGVTGVYFPAGGAICRYVNKGRRDHGVRCAAEVTGGSVVNINGIRGGALDFAIVQSDWQYYAYKGESVLRDRGPFTEMRAVFSLHGEPFQVVARTDARIRSFEDLKGKRVNIGNPGSGQRGTIDVILGAMGWTVADFGRVFELASDEQSHALCNEKIDAMVFVSGFPSGSVKEATTLCAAQLVDVKGAAIEKLVHDNIFYRKAVIPGGIYPGTDRNIETFGTLATVITSARIDEEVVYQVVKSVFGNLDDFKKQHPALMRLRVPEMIRDGLAAPLHAGALRYYREMGWR
jgi:TRAP transporter TAXI family solute receptor